jgi:hypothetical protein
LPKNGDFKLQRTNSKTPTATVNLTWRFLALKRAAAGKIFGKFLSQSKYSRFHSQRVAAPCEYPRPGFRVNKQPNQPEKMIKTPNPEK